MVGFQLTSCSYKITRSGYEPVNTIDQTREMKFVRNQTFSDSAITKIGEIKLGDSGFTLNCTESDALVLLTSEGNAAGANVINIISETRTDILSSCYRCTAELYRISDPALQVKSDDSFLQDNLVKRESKDKRRRTWMYIGSISAGLLTGYLVAPR